MPDKTEVELYLEQSGFVGLPEPATPQPRQFAGGRLPLQHAASAQPPAPTQDDGGSDSEVDRLLADFGLPKDSKNMSQNV